MISKKETTKRKTKARKKKKILVKLVMGKADKDLTWQSVESSMTHQATFFGCFPFGNDPLSGVTVKVHHFKRTPVNIVYHPFLDVHNDDIKKRIMQYNKFDTKKPIFVILEKP